MQDMYNGNFPTPNGGFDNNEAPNDWGNSGWETAGNQDDNWGSNGDDWTPDQNQDDWGDPNSQQSDDWAPQGDDQYGYDMQNNSGFMSSQPKFNNTMSQSQEDFDNRYEKQFNVANPVAEKTLSMKKVLGVLMFGVVILICIFVFLNRVHISKKVDKVAEKVVDAEVAVTSPEKGQTKQEALQQVFNGDSEETSETENVEEVPQPSNVDTQIMHSTSGTTTLLEIGNNTPINYSVPVLEASGLVGAKKKFLQGSQLVYCLDINIAVGSASQTVSYYCNYASFNAVKEGDVVLVKYQQVSDSFISISEITK